MRYAQMRKFDISNGIGIRASLFVAGCTHHCEGCFNAEYQSFKSGEDWTLESEEIFMRYVKDSNVHGVTLLGGEPMDQTMDNQLLELLKRIKTETNHSIWIYSGYTFEQIKEDIKKLKLLEQCDVLVDGKFVEELKDITLKFRGSSNQRIIDVRASLNENKIILLDL